MNYSKKERLQIAAALRAVRPLMWDGSTASCGERYICYALCSLSRRKGEGIARQVIHSRLAPYGTLRCWLKCSAGIPPGQLTDAAVQQHRLAWIDELIKEFSAP